MNKEQQIEEFQNDIIDNLFDGGTYKLAEALYNAGYRKTFTSDLASDTQKAYKEGYEKGIKETEAEIERLKADNEALQMWNSISAETIQKLSEKNERFESNMKSVLEIEKKNAVKEFAEKLKENSIEINSRDFGFMDFVGVDAIDELLKEYEQ
jgi:predicted RNase H-like nuclease (RuvC/YqgF family)